jgi:internalin A
LESDAVDGLAVARERIAREAEEKTGFLDLGMLGLRALPEELFSLKRLRRLNLGRGYFDQAGKWQELISDSELGPNAVEGQLDRLAELIQLEEFFFSLVRIWLISPRSRGSPACKRFPALIPR